MSEEKKTKKVRVTYETEIEVPDGLISDEDLIDWVANNMADWYSFEVEEVEE